MSGATINMVAFTSLRDAVGKYLADLGDKYDDMLVLTADVDTSSRIQAFKEKYPERCYNVGIAEQSLMSTAAGLAHEGFRPFCFAFAPFATMRCYEQVRTDICYSKLPVIIIGNGAGYSNAASGCTHCGLEDSALMVACNNMTVIEPGDPFQMVKVLEAAVELNAPVYIRMGREATSSLYDEDVKFKIGKALIPREGDDGAFICTGIMVHFAVEAADRIKEDTGKQIRVVDMHTIKPLDNEAVISAAKTGKVVVAQDHNLHGGLGQIVGAVIAEEGIGCKFISRGCPDEFVPIATPDFLYAKNGMDVDGLYEAMKSLL
ncbi:MAG TPA: transketolase family protein [Clostridiaceae bacterium]|nr:transketolase family protein [Clostridiaceae bacterium]